MSTLRQNQDADSIKLENVDMQFTMEHFKNLQAPHRIVQQQERLPRSEMAQPEQLEQLETSYEETEYSSEIEMEADSRKFRSTPGSARRNAQNAKVPEVFRYYSNIQRAKQPRSKSGAIVATCNACETRIKGFLTVTSNFIKHLRVRHAKIYALFAASKKCTETTIDEEQNDSFDQRIMCYIIDNALPLKTVETPSFRNLFKNTNLTVMNQVKLKCRLNERFLQMSSNIKKLLISQKYVCITTDICSDSSESNYYIVYSCHWLDAKYQRHSTALACRPFSGDNAQVLEMINKINHEYEFNNLKIVGAITNCNRKYTKAFQEFGIELGREKSAEDKSNIEELGELISKALPNRMECASEVLNLVASTDFLELLSWDKNLKELHLQIMAKCCALWRKCFCSASAEIIVAVLGDPLVCPTVDRWFSINDSISCILSQKDRLAELCSRLGLHNSCFSANDLQYLEEYRTLMTPIATTMQFLSMESNLYYGCLIPALTSLCVKLKRASDRLELIDLKSLALELQLKLKQRFANYIQLSAEANHAIIASVLCPGIKMRWLNALARVSSGHKQRSAREIEEMIIAEAARHAKASEMHVSQSAMDVAYTTGKDDFYEFDEMDDVDETHVSDLPQPSPQPSATKLIGDAEAQLQRYLEDPCITFESLARYPLLQDFALKYNTCLTSIPEEGPIHEHINRFNQMPDVAGYSVEKLILLKANCNY